MNAPLPIIYTPAGAAIADPDTGELVPVRDADDALLARIVDDLKRFASEARDARSLLETEIVGRLRAAGERRADAGAWRIEIGERREWDPSATWAALGDLVAAGVVSAREADEAMPERTERRPDGRKLNSLLTRVVGQDPAAAAGLARARSDRASVKVARVAVDATAIEDTAA